MPRKQLIRNDILPYHITARSNNREAFPIDPEDLWRILCDECLFLTYVYQVEFHAVVLMPNHFHILLTVPEHDLGIVMNDFMRSVSKRANLKAGRTGHLFGGSYHWCLIDGSRYFAHAYKYVYRNPVRAKLCDQVQDFPYSTLPGLLGLAPLPFPLYQTRRALELALPSVDPYEQMNWLNIAFPKKAEALIQDGLRKKRFAHLKDRLMRKAPQELEELI